MLPQSKIELFKLQQNSPTWDEFHAPGFRGFLTASIVPDILGFGYQSPHARFKHCTGLKPIEFTSYAQDILNQGHEAEQECLNYITEHCLTPDKVLMKPGIIVSPTYPYLAASLDAILVSKNRLVNIEIKHCKNSWVEKPIALDYFPGTLSPKYLLQVQTQMLCSGIEESLLILFDDVGFRTKQDNFMHIFAINQNAKVQQAITYYTYKFWNDINQDDSEISKVQDYWRRADTSTKKYLQGLLEEHVNNRNGLEVRYCGQVDEKEFKYIF